MSDIYKNFLNVGREKSPDQGVNSQPYDPNFIRNMFDWGSLMTQPGRAAAHNMRENQRTGDTSFGEGVALGAANMMNLGTMPAQAALAERLDKSQEANFNTLLEENRMMMSNQKNLVGELIGAVTPGGGVNMLGRGMIRGAEAIPKVARQLSRSNKMGTGARAALASTIGATEAGMYTAFTTGDLQQAAIDAGQGAAVGALAQGALNVVNLLRQSPTVTKQINDMPLTTVARNVRSALQSKFGGPEIKYLEENGLLNIEEILASDQDGAASILFENPLMFSAVVNDMDQAFAAAKKGGGGAYYDAINAINGAVQRAGRIANPEFNQAIDEVLDLTKRTSSHERKVDALNFSRQKSPEYRQALMGDALNVPRYPSGKEKAIPIAEIDALVKKAFQSQGKKSSAAALQKKIRAMHNRTITPRKKDRRGKTVGGKDVTTLTTNQLYDHLKELDEFLYNNTVGIDKDALKINNKGLRDGVRAYRNSLQAVLYNRAPNLKELDAQFTEQYRVDNAFEAGRMAGKSRKGDVMDQFGLFETFHDRSLQESKAFLEGVKQNLLENVEGKSPKQVKNYLERNPKFTADVKLVVGNDNYDKLVSALGRYSMRHELGKRALENPPASRPDGEGTNLWGILGDLGIGASGAVGMASTPLALSRTRSAMGSINRGVPQGGEIAERQALSEVMAQDPRAGLEMLNQALLEGLPVADNPLTAAFVSDTDIQEATGNDILDAFINLGQEEQ